ncbi:MAG TPA: hypothetical protein VFR24_27470 [Candidatus Angelobacter sp.]|nr:hypothetical protein [Candidatus Angelobacter sp.]
MKRKHLRERLWTEGSGSKIPGDAGTFKGNAAHFNPANRYRAAVKPGEIINPHGQKGYGGAGIWNPNWKMTMAETKKIMQIRELQELCREKAGEAFDVLWAIIQSENSADSAKLQALQMLYDRAYGKATQTNVNAQVNADGKPSEIDDAELNSRIRETLKRVERVASGEGKPTLSEDGPSDIRKLN